jgi:cysteine-S-conjugate beta-lyase
MHYNFDEIVDRKNTSSVKFDLRDKIFRNEDVIPMWVADMDFKTPPFIMEALRKRLEHEILGYSFISPSVFGSIVNWIRSRHNWEIQRDWICFSPGIVPAINLLILAFTEPGDKVIVQTPVYFPFFSAVENHGRQLVFNPLIYSNGKYKMDFDDLESKIDGTTKMLILCNPHNPTGNVWPEEAVRRIGEICLANHVLLVSDEIHSDLIYKGHRHIPSASLSDDIAANTVTCMAPSKTFNLAGLSTSFLVIPDEKLRITYEKKLDQIHIGAGNIFGFVAMEAAYTHGSEWLGQLMEYLEGNLEFLKHFIERHIPKVRVIEPEATYMVWLDCTLLKMPPSVLKEFMINKAGLGLSDGPLFGKQGEGFQRINIGCPRSVLYEALLRLQAAITKYL